MGTSDIKKIHRRIGSYLSNTNEIVIDDSVPAVLARVPLEKGRASFMSIDRIPDVNDLPFIPERLRDFSYRYATEYKKLATWATEYNVSLDTIRKWLAHTGVQSYIALTRLEKRFYTLARRSALENMVWKRLHEFMSIKITGENVGAVAKILEFSYNILHAPETLGGREKGVFNQSIYVSGTEKPVNDINPYARESRPPSPKQLEEIQKRLDRLKMLEIRKEAIDAETSE